MAKVWTVETGHFSSVAQRVMHPAYQKIIGMGPSVVTPILEELKDRPDHWFWALNAVVGVDHAEGATSVTQAAERWVSWGVSQGFID